MRSNKQSSLVPGMGRAGVGKCPGATTAMCPHGDAAPRLKGPPGAEERGAADAPPLASFAAVLASLMLCGGWKGASRYKCPLGMAWFAPGWLWGRLTAEDNRSDEGSALVLWQGGLDPPNLSPGRAWSHPRRWRDSTSNRVECHRVWDRELSWGPLSPFHWHVPGSICALKAGGLAGTASPPLRAASDHNGTSSKEPPRRALQQPSPRPRCQPRSPGSGSTLHLLLPVPAAGSQPVN